MRLPTPAEEASPCFGYKAHVEEIIRFQQCYADSLWLVGKAAASPCVAVKAVRWFTPCEGGRLPILKRWFCLFANTKIALGSLDMPKPWSKSCPFHGKKHMFILFPQKPRGAEGRKERESFYPDSVGKYHAWLPVVYQLFQINNMFFLKAFR